ncbi:MAG: Ig-like domain repeat protein [Silvibacterium sp.]
MSSPTGLAVDSQGQVYILSNSPTAGPTQVLRKVGVFGYEYFGGQLKGTTSTARVVTVANTGNDTLTLSVAGFFSGANPSNFALDPNTTTCVLSAGATLDAGRSCKIGFLFKPTGGGTFSANYVLQDNTVTNTNTIVLTGTGTLPVPTFTITSPAASTSVTAGTAITFAVSVTSTTSPSPTGKVTMLLGGAAISGSPATLNASGVASLSVVTSVTGTHTLSATYSGDANYAAAGPITRTYTVTEAASKPATVKLSSTPNPARRCNLVMFSVEVAGAGAEKPTGKVEVRKGSTVLATADLNNGAGETYDIRADGGKESADRSLHGRRKKRRGDVGGFGRNGPVGRVVHHHAAGAATDGRGVTLALAMDLAGGRVTLARMRSSTVW